MMATVTSTISAPTANSSRWQLWGRTKTVDTVSGDSQVAISNHAPTTPPQMVVTEFRSPPRVQSHQPSTRFRDMQGHRRRHRRATETAALEGHFATPPRRVPIPQWRFQAHRPDDTAPDRILHQHRRNRTVGAHRRSQSFLRYLATIRELTQAMTDVQRQWGGPACDSLHISPIRLSPLGQHRSQEPPPATMLGPSITGLRQDMIDLSIHSHSPRPSSSLPTIQMVPPTSATLSPPPQLIMDPLWKVNSRIAEDDTQLPAHLTLFDLQISGNSEVSRERHPVSCECDICQAESMS
ncbi:hypothetical protein FVER53590_25478 [Fusarium verticillioides]|nr:hypothetical protein FVER53590_25478 [Fusarium verticillioides]